MKKVVIEPGCITCGTCEFMAEKVFKVTDICYVQEDADLKEHAQAIKLAAQACPVNVIKFQE